MLSAHPEWVAAFPPESVGSYLPSGFKSAMVVIGGPRTTESAQAKEAFAQALRKSQSGPQLVLTDEPLGEVSALSDAVLTTQAQKYAIAIVVVLRLFSLEAGKPPLAVGSVFGSDGALLSSFSTSRGTPLARNAQSVGVSSATVDAVSSSLEKRESKKPVTRRGREPEVIPDDAPRIFATLTEREESKLRPELRRIVGGSVNGYRFAIDDFVCTLPCKQEVALPDMDFYIGGAGVTPSESFRLGRMARSGRVDLKVKAGDGTAMTLGILGATFGVPAVISGIALLIVGVTQGSRTASVYNAGGVATLLAGGLMVGFGIPAIVNNTTTVTPAEK
jgi:hypothetical protein